MVPPFTIELSDNAELPYMPPRRMAPKVMDDFRPEVSELVRWDYVQVHILCGLSMCSRPQVGRHLPLVRRLPTYQRGHRTDTVPNTFMQGHSTPSAW